MRTGFYGVPNYGNGYHPTTTLPQEQQVTREPKPLNNVPIAPASEEAVDPEISKWVQALSSGKVTWGEVVANLPDERLDQVYYGAYPSTPGF